MLIQLRPGALTALSALLLACADGASVRAETLAEAAALAYANNPTIQAQRAAQQAVDENYVQARSRYGLQAQANVTQDYQQARGKYYKGQVQTSSHTEGLSLSQPLFTGGRNRAAVSAAEADILAQREALRQAETQVLQQVVTVYVAVRRDLQTLEVYRDTVMALERQLRQVETQFKVGEVTQTDVDQTRGRLELSRVNVATSQAQLEISRSQYLQVVGQNPGTLQPEPTLQVLPDLDTAFDLAEAQNPALGAARYNEQAARARVAQARANYLPSVTAQAQISQSPVSPSFPTLGDQTISAVTLTLTQPLYTSGLYGSQVRQTLAQVNQARAQIEVSRRAAVQAVGQAWSQLVAARLSLVSDTKAVAATEAAFYGVRTEQPYGLRTQIDVLNAEQELNGAQVRLLQDRYTEYVARAAVLASAGALDLDTLSPGAPAIRPETSFNKVKGKGVPPWVGAVQALDSIGARPVAAPRPAVRDPATRDDARPPLPPPPPEASTLAPLRTATSIMEMEANTANRATPPATDAKAAPK